MESGWTFCPPYQQIPSDSRYLGQRPLLSVPGEALTQLTWLVLLFTIILRTEVALRCQKDRHISNQPRCKIWRYFETMVTEKNVYISTLYKNVFPAGRVSLIRTHEQSLISICIDRNKTWTFTARCIQEANRLVSYSVIILGFQAHTYKSNVSKDYATWANSCWSSKLCLLAACSWKLRWKFQAFLSWSQKRLTGTFSTSDTCCYLRGSFVTHATQR